MTATLNITTEITEFARRVREHLGDLPAEEVDDLTDGLEADLAEAFSESPSAGLPDPRAYALELRDAAGLPESVESRGGVRRAFGGVANGLREQRAEFAANLRKNPTTARVLDFFVELRPAWWILRAWVAFQMAEEDTTYDEATNRYVPNEGKELRQPTAPFLKVPALLQPKAEEKAGEKGND